MNSGRSHFRVLVKGFSRESVALRIASDLHRGLELGYVVGRFSGYEFPARENPKVFCFAPLDRFSDSRLAGVVGRHRQVPRTELGVEIP